MKHEIDDQARKVRGNPFVRKIRTDILVWGSCDDAAGQPPERKE